jgi:hypothetical protein
MRMTPGSLMKRASVLVIGLFIKDFFMFGVLKARMQAPPWFFQGATVTRMK